MSPQKLFHVLVLKFLERALDQNIPDGLAMVRESSVKLGGRQRPKPDLILVRAEAFEELDQTWFAPEVVELAVEVVSPESQIRDRERKPQLYARAGILFILANREGRSGRRALRVREGPGLPVR